MVGFDDGSSYSFDYLGTGQVSTINRSASDGWHHSYTAYDYDSPTADCPRLTQTRVWATNWSDQNGVPHEVTTQFGVDGDAHVLTAPDGTVYKEFYGGTGGSPVWQKGLVTSTQVVTGSTIQKTNSTSWTQDNPNVSYLTNPRVTQTDIEDASGNHRRTMIDYGDTNLGYVQWG